MESQKSGRWSAAEDLALSSAVSEALKISPNAPLSFSDLVKCVEGRSAKQAQERWENHLRPDLKRGEWSQEETYLLLDLMSRHGQDWTLICKYIPQRGFHGIKVKGRSMLKETMPKKKRKFNRKVGNLMGDADANVNESNTGTVMQKGSGSEKNGTLNGGETWTKEEHEELMMLHKRFGAEVEVITAKLQKLRPVAEVDREIVKTCDCVVCAKRFSQFVATGKSLKTAWTMEQANKLKVLYEPNLNEQPELAEEQIVELLSDENHESKSEEEILEINSFDYFQSEDDIRKRNVVARKKKRSNQKKVNIPSDTHDTSNAHGSSSRNTDFEGQERENDMSIYNAELYNTNISNKSTAGKYPYSYSAFTNENDFLIQGNAEPDDSNISLERENSLIVYASSFPENKTTVNVANFNKRTCDDEDCLERDLNQPAELSEKQQFVNMVNQMSKFPNFKDFQDTFVKFHSQQQLTRLMNSSKLYAGTCLSNPAISYMLQTKIDRESGYCDPRYNMEFIFPQAPKFDDNKPLCTLAFQVATCLCLDSDANARFELGTTKGRHWFTMNASPLNAFFQLGNFFPKLVQFGEVWTRQLLLKSNGCLGVFLVHIQFNYFNQGACRFRMQDISDQFPHIINLPPEL